ncbi:MAG: hypothetical protein AAF420_08725 [Pseudomonadota bacterium]
MNRLRQRNNTPAKPVGITFEITHMDPMGQGVDKTGERVTFIAKTLPGERGTAQVMKSRKGVRFAQVDALTHPAAMRVEADCPHFYECPGCHYLHTDYATELAFKREALIRALAKLEFDSTKIEVIAAERRNAYRTRMQLHYRQRRIGLIDPLRNAIVEIPQCEVIREELKASLQSLYNDKSWQLNVGENGHCELLLDAAQAEIAWNLPYAHGGFSQVNDRMNEHLCALVNRHLEHANPRSLLDLFCGDGNLSNHITQSLGCKRTMIDLTDTRHRDFVPLDLLKDNALSKFRRDHQRHSFDALLLDPPRAGFKHLNSWSAAFKPKDIVYVSCASATLARDLKTIAEHYSIQSVTLIDMFPGTFHFETVVHLRSMN